jgi:glycosyltransferase involved in cell wall biosynthesis
MSNKEHIWISWEKHRRNQFLSNKIGTELYEFDISGFRLKRYLFSVFKTIRLYLQKKPRIIICQNPSVVLALLSLLYSKLFNIILYIDTHNAGLALDSTSIIAKKIAIMLQRNADCIIVTNKTLQKYVEHNGGKAVVLPDNIPDLYLSGEPYKFEHTINLVFICTYASDEPYMEVFEAANKLYIENMDIGLYVTGKIPKLLNRENLSPNIHLLDFVSWEDYDRLLFSCDGLIDLTTRENCLVCGAYEAVSVLSPIILSDTKALREYFYKGACYTQNNANSIYSSIVKLITNKDTLKSDMGELKIELSYKSNELINLFKKECLEIDTEYN